MPNFVLTPIGPAVGGSRSGAVAAAPVAVRELSQIVAKPVPQHVGQENGLVAADQLRVLDPAIWQRIGRTMPPTSRGVPRQQAGCPIAPSDDLADTMVFEGAVDGLRYHLPRYRLARHTVNGIDQYAIRIEKAASGDWVLRVQLEKFRAPEIPAATQTVELAHDLLLRLTYVLTLAGGGTTTKELPFQDVGATETGTAVVATLRFATPAERDQSLSAITTAGGAAGIQVARAVQVAVPAGADAAGGTPLFRRVARGVNMVAEPNPLFLNLELNRYLYDGESPAGGGPGLTAFQLSWNDRFFTYWQDSARPQLFYYLPDAFRLARRTTAPLYPMLAIRLAGAGAKPEDTQISLEMVATPWVDSARLAAARRELAKRVPLPSSGPPAKPPASTQGGGLGGLLGGLIGGAIGGKGGATIGSQIGTAVGTSIGTASSPAGLPASGESAAAAALQFEPLIVAKAALWMALPGAGGAAGGMVERPGAQVDIRAALVDAETFALPQFQAVWDALFGASLSLMRGEVRIDLGGGAREVVPVSARIDETVGDVFQISTSPGAAPGTLQLTLANAIESAAALRRLGAKLRRGTAIASATVDGKVFDPPMEVEQNASASFTLEPAKALPGEGGVQAILDIDARAAKADPAKVWAALLDPSTPAEYVRTIDVQAVPTMFDPPAGKPDDQVQAILVQFENGNTVQLAPGKLEAQAAVRVPVSDLVLRKSGVATYRYRCQVVRRSGRLADQDWRTDSFDILIPTLPGS